MDLERGESLSQLSVALSSTAGKCDGMILSPLMNIKE